MKIRIAAAMAAMSVLISSMAFADGTSTYVEQQTGSDQSVWFPDDPLKAGGWGPNDTPIHVMPHPKRIMLLRPRTQFVMEMLKSVENM